MTGKPVFDGENALKVIFAHASQVVIPPTSINPQIPEELEAFILKCLEKKPEDRYQSAEELSAALKTLPVDDWTQEQAIEWWSEAEHLVQLEPDVEYASDYMKATTILPVNGLIPHRFSEFYVGVYVFRCCQFKRSRVRKPCLMAQSTAVEFVAVCHHDFTMH